eukprot:3973840-Prymnesium_polylepis.1
MRRPRMHRGFQQMRDTARAARHARVVTQTIRHRMRRSWLRCAHREWETTCREVRVARDAFEARCRVHRQRYDTRTTYAALVGWRRSIQRARGEAAARRRRRLSAPRRAAAAPRPNSAHTAPPRPRCAAPRHAAPRRASPRLATPRVSPPAQPVTIGRAEPYRALSRACADPSSLSRPRHPPY